MKNFLNEFFITSTVDEQIRDAAFKLGRLDLGPPSAQLETARHYKQVLSRVADETSPFRLISRLRGRFRYTAKVLEYWRTCREIRWLIRDYENSTHARYLRHLLEHEQELRQLIELGGSDVGKLLPHYRMAERLNVDTREFSSYLRVDQFKLDDAQQLVDRRERFATLRLFAVPAIYAVCVAPLATATLLCMPHWTDLAKAVWVAVVLIVGGWLMRAELRDIRTARQIVQTLNDARPKSVT